MSSCIPMDRLMQTLKVHTPGATDDLLSLELFNTVDEFFRRTLAWRYITEIQLSQGIVDYGFSVPADSQVVRVIGVTHNGLPMRPIGTAGSGSSASRSIGRYGSEFQFEDGDVRFGPETLGPPVGASGFSYSIYRPESISVTFDPDAEAVKYPLQTIMALSLATGCLEKDCGDWGMEEWMYDAFFQDWLDGTLGRLYGMPAKPWASPVHAQYHHKRFRNQMAYRKQESNRGFSYGVPGFLFSKDGVVMNNIYDAARVKLLTAALDWRAVDLMLTAWPGTPGFAKTDKVLSDITTRGFVERGSSQTITSKTVATDGTAQTNLVLIPTVPVGASITWFTMSIRKPTHNSSELLLYIDDAIELPFVPNGLDLVVSPDWLQNRGWFRP